jgi:hypothetical protein
VSLSWETHHTADRSHDLGGQYGACAKDLGESATRSFYLGFDALVQVRDLSIKCADVAHDLRSHSLADARRGALRPYTTQDVRGSAGRERSGHPAGHGVPRKPVQAALNARVRSATTKFQRLSESRRSTSDSDSGSITASRSLREAAMASSPSFLRTLPLQSTHTRAETLGGMSTTDSSAAHNLPARCQPRPPAFSIA